MKSEVNIQRSWDVYTIHHVRLWRWLVLRASGALPVVCTASGYKRVTFKALRFRGEHYVLGGRKQAPR